MNSLPGEARQLRDPCHRQSRSLRAADGVRRLGGDAAALCGHAGSALAESAELGFDLGRGRQSVRVVDSWVGFTYGAAIQLRRPAGALATLPTGLDTGEQAPMPTGNLDTSQDVVVTIPARCAPRLYREVLDEVSMAAENVMEGVTWLRSRRDVDRLDEEDLPRMREADELFAQAGGFEDGEIALKAPRSVVASLLRSCVRGAAEDINEEADDGWSSEVMRKLAGELTSWLDLFDATGLSTAQGREGAA